MQARKPFRLNITIVALVIASLRGAGSTVLADELETFRRNSKRTAAMFRPSLTAAQCGEIAAALELAPDVSQTKLVKETIARLNTASKATFAPPPVTEVQGAAQVKEVQPPQTTAPPVVPADAPVATAAAVLDAANAGLASTWAAPAQVVAAN